jgi:hypothetical protein
MIAVGDPVHYRAYAGDVYEAEVIAVRGPELIDIRCSFPGTSTTLDLKKIRFTEDGSGSPVMTAWRREPPPA